MNRAQARQPTTGYAATQRSVRRRRTPNAVRERWPPFLRYVLVFLVLVFIGRVHEAMPGLGSLPLATPLVVLAAAGLLRFGYTKRLSVILRAPQIRLALGFLVVCLISVPFSLWPGGAMAALMAYARLCVFALLLTLAIVTADQLGTLATAFAVAAGILVTGQILQSFAGMHGFTRLQSLSFDRNDVALFCVMGVPFALAWAASGRRLLGFGLAAYLTVGVVSTSSRGGFLALGVLGLVLLARSTMLSKLKKVAIVAGIVGLAAVTGSAEYWERMSSIVSPAEDYNFQNREGRIEIWKRGIGYVAANPLTGVGIGNFPVAEGETLENLGYGVKWSTAHSSYMLAAAELGIPGILLFLVLVGSIWREARRATLLVPRGRGPPRPTEASRLAMLGDATGLSLVGYLAASVFLSAAYSVALLFLVSITASLGLLRRQAIRERSKGINRQMHIPA